MTAPRRTPPRAGGGATSSAENEVVQAAAGFFGATSEAVAKAVQKVFSEQGMPDAYIKGDEGSGAIRGGAALWLGLADAQGLCAGEGLLAGPQRRLRFRRQCVEELHAGLQSGQCRPALSALSRRRRQLLFRGRDRRELSAQRQHHHRADAHRRGPEGRAPMSAICSSRTTNPTIRSDAAHRAQRKTGRVSPARFLLSRRADG